MNQIKFEINIKDLEIFRTLVECGFSADDIEMYIRFKFKELKDEHRRI